MNRKMRRVSNANGKRLQRKEWSELVEISDYERAGLFSKCTASHVFRNNKYIVFVKYKVRRVDGLYCQVMCRRSDEKPICSWSDLFRIKNELFGEEVEAVQFLPKVSELIDKANLYWFFVKMEDDDENKIFSI